MKKEIYEFTCLNKTPFGKALTKAKKLKRKKPVEFPFEWIEKKYPLNIIERVKIWWKCLWMQ